MGFHKKKKKDFCMGMISYKTWNDFGKMGFQKWKVRSFYVMGELLLPGLCCCRCNQWV
jgi:hypothetical protein